MGLPLGQYHFDDRLLANVDLKRAALCTGDSQGDENSGVAGCHRSLLEKRFNWHIVHA